MPILTLNLRLTLCFQGFFSRGKSRARGRKEQKQEQEQERKQGKVLNGAYFLEEANPVMNVTGEVRSSNQGCLEH